MERTLLLSQSYEPLRAISWRRAFCLILLGKVEVLEKYGTVVRTPNRSYAKPAVVRLVARICRYERPVKFSRSNVIQRDQSICQYCGEKKAKAELTCDHVIPKAQGGATSWDNVVAACSPCNRKKGNRTPKQASLQLRSRPRRPEWGPLFVLQITRETIPAPWRSYCGWMFKAA